MVCPRSPSAWRSRSARRATEPSQSTAAPYIALAGLLVALLPIGGEATEGPVTRTIVVLAVSAVLLLAGSFAASTGPLRPYLDVAAMRRDAPIAIPDDATLEPERAAAWCREAGMLGLASRLAKE